MESFDELSRTSTQVELIDGNHKEEDSQKPGGELTDIDVSGSQPGKYLEQIQAASQPANQPEPLPPLYPQLSRRPPDSPTKGSVKGNDEDDESPEVVTKFNRSLTPESNVQRNKGAVVSKVGDEGVIRMHKFSLYETASFFYIIGSDLLDSSFRILKIDRTAEPGDLTISEDDIVYTEKETNQILNAIDEGNKSTGGLKLKSSFWGLLGFIRFTGIYYMLCITKRKHVAMIGGHYIYQIDGTDMIPLTTAAYKKSIASKNPDESRFISILNNLDLSRSFYFSYSYDVTRTLQFNIMRERRALQQGLPEPLKHDHNDMFVWNHHLLKPAVEALHNPYDWCLSIVHGYVDQAALSIYWGRTVYIAIIARRSRFFAGARYLKRGINDLGYVANDVETEQIVSEMLTTSFHAPGPNLYASPNWTSHVQHRGSIPLFWMQDSTSVSPKPDINISIVDPFYSATALHFDNLFQRYGTPICVLNLIKSRERVPREAKLLPAYATAIAYLNQFLPDDKKILYRAWDMSRASKTRDQDVIGTLEAIAEDMLPKTGFFQNGNDRESGLKIQNGVVRTNCIDCLDRTNAAQFVIAKKALGYQLQALGVIEEPSVEYDSDAVDVFTHMWHDHGDTIAIQYGGSHLVNTMATYRKINQWTSHSRDMIESFKRYYNNSFMDAQRQEAYNLFLGNYVFAKGQPLIWELANDYYLHHLDPRSLFKQRRPSYRQWFNPKHLEGVQIPPSIWPTALVKKSVPFFDDFWIEYYRPLKLSSFKKIFSYNMQSNLRYIHVRSTQEGRYDLSPFRIRTTHDGGDAASAGHKSGTPRRKGVKILSPCDHNTASDAAAPSPSIDARPVISPVEPQLDRPKPNTLGPWLDAQQQLSRRYAGIIKEPSTAFKMSAPPPPKTANNRNNAQATTTSTLSANATKAELALQAFTYLVTSSLNPAVTAAETREYAHYVAHPLSLPLVVSSDIDYSKAPVEFLAYLSKTPQPLQTASAAATGAAQGEGSLPVAGATAAAAAYDIDEQAEASRDVYAEFLAPEVLDSGRRGGLTVTDEDLAAGDGKKRYKAYRQWLRGKSLFKQRQNVGGEPV